MLLAKFFYSPLTCITHSLAPWDMKHSGAGPVGFQFLFCQLVCLDVQGSISGEWAKLLVILMAFDVDQVDLNLAMVCKMSSC